MRTIDDSELELMLTWRNAPSVRKNMYTQHVISLEEHLSWWQRVKSREDQQYFIYEYKGEALGVVAFTDINTYDASSSWAFYASPEASRGTGSRMEFLALEHAFGALALRKLYCEVLTFNMPVVNLHKKFGFFIEGTFRKQRRVDDSYVDVIRLGIFHSEWQEERNSILRKLTSGH